MYYLVISKRGFYVSLSKKTAEEKSRVLGDGHIMTCWSFRDVINCVKDYGAKYELVEVILERLVYWKRKRTICLKDLQLNESCVCHSDGTVVLIEKNGSERHYKICQNRLVDSKKTVALLKKRGFLQFFDFEEDVPMCIDADGIYWRKKETKSGWEKLSAL